MWGLCCFFHLLLSGGVIPTEPMPAAAERVEGRWSGAGGGVVGLPDEAGEDAPAGIRFRGEPATAQQLIHIIKLIIPL